MYLQVVFNSLAALGDRVVYVFAEAEIAGFISSFAGLNTLKGVALMASGLKRPEISPVHFSKIRIN